MHTAATITIRIVVNCLRRISGGMFQSVAINKTIPSTATPTNAKINFRLLLGGSGSFSIMPQILSQSLARISSGNRPEGFHGKDDDKVIAKSSLCLGAVVATRHFKTGLKPKFAQKSTNRVRLASSKQW